MAKKEQLSKADLKNLNRIFFDPRFPLGKILEKELAEKSAEDVLILTRGLRRMEAKHRQLHKLMANGELKMKANRRYDLVSGSGSDDAYFTAAISGVKGNDISVDFKIAGNNTPLSVVVTGDDIVVNVKTDGAGLGISTLQEVHDKMILDASVKLKGVLKLLTAGTGVVDTASGVLKLQNGEQVCSL